MLRLILALLAVTESHGWFSSIRRARSSCIVAPRLFGRGLGSTPATLAVIPEAPTETILEELLQHPAVSSLAVDLRPRSRLKPKHQHLFQRNDTQKDENAKNGTHVDCFHQLGSIVCETGVVSRKEFLETFAAAALILDCYYVTSNNKTNQELQPPPRRIADLAAGHGLLAWFLLVMASSSSSSTMSSPISVICVDRCIPPAAEIIATAMMQQFPHLQKHYTYVQGDLRQVQAHSSCLLVSVHACGSLTDHIVEMALATQSSMAVVPCCHSVKRGNYQPHVLSPISYEQVVELVEQRKTEMVSNKHEAVANVVDEVRCQTLSQAHYRVETRQLPASFTGRNRLLLAWPICAVVASRPLSLPSQHPFFEQTLPQSPQQTTSHGPLDIVIPLADNPESVAHCRSLSAKERGTQRLVHQIPKHFSLTLAMSLWLDASTSSGLTREALQVLVDSCCCQTQGPDDLTLECAIRAHGDPVLQASTGRASQLYKFQYTRQDRQNMSGAPRSAAKRIHQTLRQEIATRYGDVIR
mmetsp:Transcript_32907/g.68583  ORF Transcript_32907/g.68583 Transcript_32907/m.68583 type:complete len:526 (-) Transcript_32907:1926-3503(-)